MEASNSSLFSVRSLLSFSHLQPLTLLLLPGSISTLPMAPSANEKECNINEGLGHQGTYHRQLTGQLRETQTLVKM